jgi:2-dehydro-3-deoxyglucarate aldolase
LRESLESGDTVFGAAAATRSPAMIDVYGAMGFDYIWLDHEHIGPASSDGPNFESIARAAAAAGIEPLCRIESGRGDVVRKVLDAGVRSLVVPRVETAEDVRRAVEASRFSYGGGAGDRGVGTSLASDWGDRSGDYTTREDANVLVGVMLENAAALDNVHDILRVVGVGFGWIGPADLSVSLGHPLEYDHPEIEEAIETFRDAGADHGVPIGIDAGYAGGVEAAVDSGYRMVTVGSEISAARRVLGEALAVGQNATR